MIFSKLLPRWASFAVMVIAGLCFVAIAIVNLGLEVGDIVLQLLAITFLIVVLIGAAMLSAFIIRWIISRLERREELDENDIE